MTTINTLQMLSQMRTMQQEAMGAAVNQVASPVVSFDSLLKDAFQSVNTQINEANDLKSRYELGDPTVSLSKVMIEGQKASIGLQAVIVGRNKFVQTYQEIMNMSF